MNIHSLKDLVLKALRLKLVKILIILIISGVILMTIEKQFSAAEYGPTDQKRAAIIRSENFINEKFTNKVKWVQPSFFEYLPIMRDMLFKNNSRKPEIKLPSIPLASADFFSKQKDILHAAWFGHSSVILNFEGNKILFDPVFEKRISIFGPSRFNMDFPLEGQELPGIDIVIISHNHYDHLNKFTIKKLKDKTANFIVPLGVGAQLEKWGVQRDRIIELDWWQKSKIKNMRIVSTPFQHFSGRGLSDRNSTLWSSWVLEGEKYKIFFSGDSGYFDGFKTIGEKFGPFDITFLECGAYHKKWQHIHMLPEETVKAHLDLKGRVLHPVHLGAFNLSLHSWFEPMERLSAEAEKKGVRYVMPLPGEITNPDNPIRLNKWWEKYMNKFE